MNNGNANANSNITNPIKIQRETKKSSSCTSVVRHWQCPRGIKQSFERAHNMIAQLHSSDKYMCTCTIVLRGNIHLQVHIPVHSMACRNATTWQIFRSYAAQCEEHIMVQNIDFSSEMDESLETSLEEQFAFIYALTIIQCHYLCIPIVMSLRSTGCVIRYMFEWTESIKYKESRLSFIKKPSYGESLQTKTNSAPYTASK